ncbi:1658_t:CDS:2 [Ambispora gerdemannii]|uniref:1658_t:CDS:1 n=1 Tax=Ambispora gerdemannii TaxID=144530 RepID=A0A9N9BPA1_9GLOM|nr:1658_t:CDS:2 [Ambispora gerdemannii]
MNENAELLGDNAKLKYAIEENVNPKPNSSNSKKILETKVTVSSTTQPKEKVLSKTQVSSISLIPQASGPSFGFKDYSELENVSHNFKGYDNYRFVEEEPCIVCDIEHWDHVRSGE